MGKVFRTHDGFLRAELRKALTLTRHKSIEDRLKHAPKGVVPAHGQGDAAARKKVFKTPCLWMSSFLLTMCAIMPAAAYDPSGAAKAFADDFNQIKNAMQSAALVLGGWQGNDSKVADLSIERVLDQPAWQALWARHAPGETAPAVDFSAAMVIAIFTGEVRTRVTPSVTLDDVTETDKITLIAKSFFNDVITEDRGNLYLFVVLRRSPKPVSVISRSISIMGPTDRVMIEFSALPQ